MTRALKQNVVIGPGGVIEIRSPELPEGVKADVIVLYEEKEKKKIPLSKLFGKGKGLFATPEEADAFLRNERDQWD